MQTQNRYNVRDNDLLLTTLPAERVYTIKKIRDLEEEDRPREKLIQLGPQALTMPELLSVLLNTGTKKEGVTEMSERIIKEYGEKAIINMTDPKRVSEEFNIPLIKACMIVACGELGRRFYKKSETGLVILRTAKDVFDYTKDMRDLSREHLRGIYLDTHHKVIHDEVISIGTINSNIVHAREIFKSAIEYNAAALILVHNHPSGVVDPSTSDVTITNQLIEAGRIIGINLLDHIIVTKEDFKSIDAHY